MLLAQSASGGALAAGVAHSEVVVVFFYCCQMQAEMEAELADLEDELISLDGPVAEVRKDTAPTTFKHNARAPTGDEAGTTGEEGDDNDNDVPTSEPEVRACVHACIHACVYWCHTCMRAYVYACVYIPACMCVLHGAMF